MSTQTRDFRFVFLQMLRENYETQWALGDFMAPKWGPALSSLGLAALLGRTTPQ